MRTFLSLVGAACVFYALSWFLKFQFDPYENCIDHPNEELSENYYQCNPFGFTLKKGAIENRNKVLINKFSNKKKTEKDESESK
jgi:hypothetical protein